MNNLQRDEWRLSHNFFPPRSSSLGKSASARKPLKSTTPLKLYQRIMDSEYIVKHIKNALSKQLEHLDPFELRNIKKMKLKKITRFRKHLL